MEDNRCPGCMRQKNKRPVCEHCGFDENSCNSNHQLPIGTVLKDQYVIGKVLGQGGFGITYLGWDRYLEMPVAIKEYFPTGVVMRDISHSNGVANCEGQTDSGFDRNRRRFLREAQALAKLGDVPEVVHVMGLFPENGTAYIVMEYIQGQTLKERVQKQGVLNPKEMMAVFGPVLDGLQKVHDAGLVHRDISPDNIVLTPSGGVKLLDFGAVRDFAGEHSASTEAILKPGYAPLEQYQRRAELGPRTDLYALCGTIYFCLTGEVPPDAPERMMDGVEPAWEKIPGLSQTQLDALGKGMALPIRSRVGSAAELKALLGTPEKPGQEAATHKIVPEIPQQEQPARQIAPEKPRTEQPARQMPPEKTGTEQPDRQIPPEKSKQEQPVPQLPQEKPKSYQPVRKAPPERPEREQPTNRPAPERPKPELQRRQVPSENPTPAKPRKKKRVRKLPILVGSLLALVMTLIVCSRLGAEPEKEQIERPAVTETGPVQQPTETEPDRQISETESETTQTEPAEEPVFPCYVTYSDHGMVLKGEGLQITVDKDRSLVVTVESPELKQQPDAQIQDDRSWRVVMHAGENAYALNASAMSYPEIGYYTADRLDVHIGPQRYFEAGDLDHALSKFGCMWRCTVPQASTNDPSVKYDFDFRSLTGFAVESWRDGTDEGRYYREYELAGEMPAEETIASEEEGEEMYPKGNHTEKYTYTINETSAGTVLEGEYLEIVYTEDREMKVTLKHVPVEDSYYIKTLSENRGAVKYGWHVQLKQGNSKLTIRTMQDTMGIAGEYWIGPDYMDHGIQWTVGTNGHYEHIKKVQFLEDGVIWWCKIPEEVDGVAVTLDLKAQTEIETAVWDGQKKMQVVRTYKPAE